MPLTLVHSLKTVVYIVFVLTNAKFFLCSIISARFHLQIIKYIKNRVDQPMHDVAAASSDVPTDRLRRSGFLSGVYSPLRQACCRGEKARGAVGARSRTYLHVYVSCHFSCCLPPHQPACFAGLDDVAQWKRENIAYAPPFDPPPAKKVGTYADPELLAAAQRVGGLLQLRSDLNKLMVAPWLKRAR